MSLSEQGTLPAPPLPSPREHALALELEDDVAALRRASAWLDSRAARDAETIARTLKAVAWRLKNPRRQGIS